MKTLFFDAVAPHPDVAPAVMRQVEKTLRPFNRYIDQAIRTAERRQARYELPWKRVDERRRITVTPVDLRVWVPRREPRWRVPDWPADVEPDPGRPLMVLNRDQTIEIRDCRRYAGQVRLRLDKPLRDDDQVVWCGRPCTVIREPEPGPPSSVRDAAGASLALLHAPRPDEDGWVLLLEGWSGDGHLIVDGEPVAARAVRWDEGLHSLSDGAGQVFDASGGTVLEVVDLPAKGLLTGDNGVRFEWAAQRRQGRRHEDGVRVQLLPPLREDPEEDYVDPRAAFCDGEIDEVWTQRRHSKSTAYRVRHADPDSYQLVLDRLPQGESLFLPVNTHGLRLQKRALRQLRDAPLPHHAGLVRLCENPKLVKWPRTTARRIERWTTLTDETRDGTPEQRAFVAKALGSPDLTLLEGPPGSGKTTAICELIQQCVNRGQRVLLCASTNVAIDNVLERLIKAGARIDPVRIGRIGRVDERVQETQLDQRIEDLVKRWQSVPHLSGRGDGELRDMAERTVISAANLTCGTTMGIVRHPLFRDRDRTSGDRPITTMPHWDVLIVDEASKTLIQEFLVPALMARRWVVVGDVRQLAPFADRADIVANLGSLADDRNRPVFPADHRRARLLLFRLTRPDVRGSGARWLVVEEVGVIDRLVEELRHEAEPPLSAVRVVSRKGGARRGAVHEVTVDQVREGDPAALPLLACDVVLVQRDLLLDVADRLPGDLLHHRDLTKSSGRLLRDDNPLLFRHEWWLAQATRRMRGYRDRGDKIDTFAAAQEHERRWLAEHDLASEMAWRLIRRHELKHSRNQKVRDRLVQDLGDLMPVSVDISEPIGEIQDIGLPSIIEVLQEGIGAERTSRPSALTEGMPLRQPGAFRDRFVSLSYQHRMHPDISDFPRNEVYGGRALKDANTINARDREVGWGFLPFPGRRVWVDVNGRMHGSVNRDEVEVMANIVREFLEWAKTAGPPRGESRRLWEVACLSFYTGQERAISDMLRRETPDSSRLTRFTAGHVEFVCATVDRFQGREADLVLLSMRNTRRVGFLDSPNRLNVALTRARQQLVVIGNAANFAHSGRPELEALVKDTPRIRGERWSKRAKGRR